MNTSPALMNYYLNNQGNNNHFYTHNNEYTQQNYYRNFQTPQMRQQQQLFTTNYNQLTEYNMCYNRSINPINQTYTNQTVQPNQVEEISIIQTLKYVSEKYPELISMNQSNTGIDSKVKVQSYPRFFVIKSFTEEDIHKVFII